MPTSFTQCRWRKSCNKRAGTYE